ncbi:MAG: hypothetical protein HY849_02295 [Nitrosomonadales bacterium]|nr:hypothetical protein [Nitrosomonadales bacterium]
MRLSSLIFAALITFALGKPLAAGPDVQQLEWMAGCWQGQSAEPGTVEHWLSPAGGTMLGVSRTVKQGKTVEFEFMQLRQLGQDGSLAFVAQPSGRPPTTFRLLRLGTFAVEFQNLEHDFPQRISYSRPEPSRLLASIEGSRNGAIRKIEFSFIRVSCDASPNSAPR